MKRNVMYSLLTLALTWTAFEYATDMYLRNKTQNTYTLWTDNKRCNALDQWAWVTTVEAITIKPGEEVCLRAGYEVSSELLIPDNAMLNDPNLPVFAGTVQTDGFRHYYYKAQTPRGQVWIFDIVTLGQTGGKAIEGDGWVTRAALQGGNKGRLKTSGQIASSQGA